MFSSGGLLERGARYNVATARCSVFYSATQGFGESAVAGDSVLHNNIGYSQSVYQFSTPAKATAFFAGSFSTAGRCRSATVTIGGSTLQVTTQLLAMGSIGRFRAFRDYTAISSPDSGPSEIFDNLYVVAGNDVYILTPLANPPASPPGSRSASSLILKLIARVQALR